MAMAAAVIALMLVPNITLAQQRSAVAHPHGLPFESPQALSPAAYDFFHPASVPVPGHGGVSPVLAPRGQLRESAVQGGALTSASVARSDQDEGGVAPVKPARRGGVRDGSVTGVFVGAAVVMVAALGVAYAVARRCVAHGDAEAAGAPKSNA